MKNKKAIKKFWKKIRFKYKLILINDTTFKKVFSCELSQLSAFIITLFISLLFIFLVVVVIIGTPLKSYLPGYMDSYLRSEIINVQMRLDSLSEINDIRMRYLDNVKNILSGDIKPDSVAPLDSMVIKVTSDSLYNKSELEMAFVDNFEQEEKYNLSVIINNTTGKTFFTPVRGVLSQKYNKQDKNYGVSVLCAGNAHISTPLEDRKSVG